MKYLKSYKNHNEGIKSNILKAGLAGSMLVSSPNFAKTDVKATTEISSSDDISKYKNSAKEISRYRKSLENTTKDAQLSNILAEIESNINGDSSKFVEVYNKLSSHIKDKYGYDIAKNNVDELSESTKDNVSEMSIFDIMGWLGSICLAICGIPQAWQSYKDKNSNGISWGFVILWTTGELLALAYVYDKLDLPLVMNYATNILILAIILYFKINPKTDELGDTPQE